MKKEQNEHTILSIVGESLADDFSIKRLKKTVQSLVNYQTKPTE
ncbi:hypothetical protein [Enterococcus faecium]|nr:hypothetical protein [Enterococcus faecium]